MEDRVAFIFRVGRRKALINSEDGRDSFLHETTFITFVVVETSNIGQRLLEKKGLEYLDMKEGKYRGQRKWHEDELQNSYCSPHITVINHER